MAITYSFVSRWETPATVEQVWNILQDTTKWPNWWDSFTHVETLQQGSFDGTGTVCRYKLRSPMGYTLTFDLEITDVITFNIISGKASGELVGTGTWVMVRHNDTTHIECHWNVCTTKPWMNALAFLLRPVFIYNHEKVMARGARALSGKLQREVKVIA